MIRRFQALAAVVSAAVPGANPVSVHRVEGATSSRYDTIVVQDNHGDRWVVRAPLDPSAGAQQDNAALLLPHLASRLPFAVPLPVGSARLRDRSRALVYPWLDGLVLAFTSLPGGPGLAAHIGECLAHIHNLPPSLCDDLGVPSYQATDCRERCLIDLDRLAATGCIPPHLLHTWEQRLDAVHLWRFAPTVVHGSITERHLLATFADPDDAATGTISAVLGWDGVHVADPAVDFAPLAATAPAAAFDSVIECYAMHRKVEFDPALPERARLLAELHLAHTYAAAVTSGDRGEKRRLAVALREVEERYLDEHHPLVAAPAVAATTPSPVVTDPASSALLPDRVRGAQPDSRAAIAPFGDESDDIPDVLRDHEAVGEPSAEDVEHLTPDSTPVPPSCSAPSAPLPQSPVEDAVAEREEHPSTPSSDEPETDALPATPLDVSHADDSAIEIDHSSAAPVTPVIPRAGTTPSATPRAIPIGRVPDIHAPASRRIIPLGPAATEPAAALPPDTAANPTPCPMTDGGTEENPGKSHQPETYRGSAPTPATPDSEPTSSEQLELVPTDHVVGAAPAPEREERRRQRSEHRRRTHARRSSAVEDPSPDAQPTP